jgi:hypothetical protein
MPFTLHRTTTALEQLEGLRNDNSLAKHFRAVSKCLRLLAENPRHPGLQTHEFSSLKGKMGEKVFEAYAQNKPSGAYRVFWHYGPNKGEVTIVAITPHP